MERQEWESLAVVAKRAYKYARLVRCPGNKAKQEKGDYMNQNVIKIVMDI